MPVCVCVCVCLTAYLSTGASVDVGNRDVSDKRSSRQVLVDLSVTSGRQSVDAYCWRVVVEILNEDHHLNTNR